ncbi:MAG: BspA family leucine-rich repeat surface protein [Alphaproteobacteria bacterium]|nr:BspA family leucine-rich repeat surface protein [Alphaproteobacteria bacterium]
MKKLSNKLLLSAIAVSFISSAVGISHARDYYYFENLSGSLQANPATPFDGSENPEQQGSVSIAVESISMKASDTNKTFAITLTPSGGINADDVAVSFSLANEDVVLASDVSITGTGANRTLTIAKAKASGTVNITLSAVVNKVQEGTKIASIDVSDAVAENPFVTTWEVNAGDTIIFPTKVSSGYNGRICWDDDSDCNDFTNYHITHTYSTGGRKTVKITGDFPYISHVPTKMKTVENLGNVGWKSFNRSFSYSRLTSFTAGDCDTSGVADMSEMFYNAEYITNIDLRGLDTSNVTNMNSMFENANNITSLNISSFDTRKVTNMGDMFWGLESLTTLDVSSFDTSNVTHTAAMFGGMKKLTSLDVSNFNTSSLVDPNGMFYGLESLTTLDISNFDTSKVTNMTNMFGGDSYTGLNNIANLNLSGLDTTKVVYLNSMMNASNLSVIDYSSSVSSSIYSSFLSTISNSNAKLKNTGSIRVGGNTCSDATCSSAKATLEGKGWVFSSN